MRYMASDPAGSYREDPPGSGQLKYVPTPPLTGTTSLALIGYSPVIPMLVRATTETMETNTIVHNIIGKASPDITFGVVGRRFGTLSMVAEDFGQSMLLLDMHTFRIPVLLTDTVEPGIGMRYVPTGSLTRTVDDTTGLWVVSVDFQEIDA